MTKCRIISDLWRKGTIIACSSEDPQFPAEYTQDDNVAEIPFRSLSCASLVTIDNDLGSAKAYNYIAFLNHNFTSEAIIQVIGADDSGFTTGVVTSSINPNGNNLRAFLPESEFVIYVRDVETLRTKRYLRVLISDTSNPAGYIQIGRVIIGQYFEPSRSFGPRQHGVIADSQVSETPSGAMFVILSRPGPEGMILTFKGEHEADRLTFMAMFKELKNEYAFDICMDYNSPNSFSYWVVMTELSYPDQGGHYDYWTVTLALKEHA